MSRHDAHLITGLSSASSRRVQRERAQKTEEKRSEIAKVLPYAEMLEVEITKLRNEIRDEARAMIDPSKTAKEIQIVTAGARWAEGKLMRLQSNLTQKYRIAERKSKQETTDE